MKFSVFSVFILAFCSKLDASRILFVFPCPSQSHVIFAQGLSTLLAQSGHEVTMLSPFPLSKPVKNHRDIKIPLGKNDASIENLVKNPNHSIGDTIMGAANSFLKLSDTMFEMPEFKKLLKEEKFDLIVIGMFMNNFWLGLSDHFKCPSIMLSANVAYNPTNHLFGNPLEVSAVPNILVIQTEPMNFLQRVRNFLVTAIDHLGYTYFDKLQRDAYNKYFPSDRYISYEEACRNISLGLFNSHFSQGIPRPFVPAMIEVGGLQVKPEPDPLPNDLKDWLDGAEHGAILFSLGSSAKSTFLPKEKLDAILKAFAKLKQRVVMKWESDELENRPKNVLTKKWLPQDDILAHENVKLFISHCGIGSVVESKFHGVPIVALPLFADQEANTKVIVGEGWGVRVDSGSLTEESLFEAIREVLENPKYTRKVQRISQLYRDRPISARETAIFWVEYVIRHRGAPHLQYPAVHLSFWQRISLDVIAFLLALIFIFKWMVVKAFKFCMSKLFGGSKKLHSKND